MNKPLFKPIGPAGSPEFGPKSVQPKPQPAPRRKLAISRSPWTFADLLESVGSIRAYRDRAKDLHQQSRNYALQGPGRSEQGRPLRDVQSFVNYYGGLSGIESLNAKEMSEAVSREPLVAEIRLHCEAQFGRMDVDTLRMIRGQTCLAHKVSAAEFDQLPLKEVVRLIEAEPADPQAKLTPSEGNALRQSSNAEREGGCKTDDEAYDWLKEEENKLPKRETWKKHLAKARKKTGTSKKQRRAGRTGRSVVSEEQL